MSRTGFRDCRPTPPQKQQPYVLRASNIQVAPFGGLGGTKRNGGEIGKLGSGQTGEERKLPQEKPQTNIFKLRYLHLPKRLPPFLAIACGCTASISVLLQHRETVRPRRPTDSPPATAARSTPRRCTATKGNSAAPPLPPAPGQIGSLPGSHPLSIRDSLRPKKGARPGR